MKPRRALWGWGGVVLGLHALVLANLPRNATPLVAPALAHTFTTRLVELPAPAPVPAALSAAQRSAATPAAAAAPVAVRSPARPAKPAPRRAPVPGSAAPQAAQAVEVANPVVDTAAEDSDNAVSQAEPGMESGPSAALDPLAHSQMQSQASAPASEDGALSAQPLQPAQPGDSVLQASAPSAETAPDAAGSATAPPAPAASPAPGQEVPVPSSAADTAVGQAVFAPGAAQAQPGPPPAVRLPAPQKLKFDVTGQAKSFQYSARAELLWQHDGQSYQARQQISLMLLGSRTQSSSGTLGSAGLQPQRFGDRTRSEKAAHFNYDQQRVTFSANAPEAILAPGTQDRLSVFVQLGALLAAAPERYPVGTRIQLATAGTGSVDAWTFTVEGEETLNLPLGSLQTLRLQRLPRADHGYDQKAQLWLAPELGYLPARIRLTQANGDFADLRLMEHSAP